MLERRSNLLLVAAAIAVATWSRPLGAEQLEKTKKVGGTTVQYKVVLPNGYDPATPYPGILALGGGPQTMNTVDSDSRPQLPRGGREARLHRDRSRGAGWSVVLRGRSPHLSRVSQDDAGGLQDPGQQVSHRRAVQRRHRRVSRRGRQSAVLPLRDRVPRIHVGAERRPSSRPFRRCACSCTSANSTSTDGTTR